MHICIYIYIYIYIYTVYVYMCIYGGMYVYMEYHIDVLALVMETGWSPYEGRPYYSMAIFRRISDIRHLIIT